MTETTDRELLTLAARAAGIALVEKPFLHNGRAGYALTEDGYWSSLLSDADAFRLAVKLNFNMRNLSFLVPDARTVQVGIAEWWDEEVPTAPDPCAAVRRAITHAAAIFAAASLAPKEDAHD